MNDLVDDVVRPQGQAVATGGAMQSQTRELAEVRTKYVMAQEFPRDERAATAAIVRAFADLRTAESAEYQYARGGTDIKGPSIHAAQTMAALWGNLEHGWREVTRYTGPDGRRYSEVEAYAVDLQTRVPSRIGFPVAHWRDTKSGGYAIRDERDVYELCANMAQRRKRQCILNLIPQAVIDLAMEQAATTVATRADTSPEAMGKMLEAFAALGVSKAQIEGRIQRKLEAIGKPQVITLKRIYQSLRDGMSTALDWFEPDAAAAATGTGGAEPKTTAQKARDAIKRAKKEPPAEPAAGGQDATQDAGKGVGTAGTDDGAGEAQDAPSAEQLRDRIMRAADRDAAWLVMDEARGLPGLTPQDHESLVELIDQRFPNEEER